jgi:hypothetical protein
MHYLAPQQVLCTLGRCRIRDSGGRILQWDDGHFTYAGSNYMAVQMLARFLIQ